MFNPILGGLWHVRWLGGEWVNLPTPLISWSIAPNATKLGSLVVNQTRIKKLYMSFWFWWWRHQILLMTSSKSVISKGSRENQYNFLNFWKLIRSSIRINCIYTPVMRISGIIPGSIPGNNGKKAPWRHNDVTWRHVVRFSWKFQEKFFSIIWRHCENLKSIRCSKRKLEFSLNYRNNACSSTSCWLIPYNFRSEYSLLLKISHNVSHR